MAPVWEALARRGNDMKLRYFRCRHELLAVSLASGYYKATGRSQIVFLPTSLGVQNAAMGLSTALQERTPMTALSPDTLTYGDDPDGDPGAEWPSLLTDHPGPARNAEVVVKWTKRARTPSDLVHELRRARFVAESVPTGPTLLEIPFQLLMGEGHADNRPWVFPTPVVATPDHIDRMAQILASATNPIIVTEHGGRTDADRDALIRIAEALSAPVFEVWMPAYHNFPRSHPLYGLGPWNRYWAKPTPSWWPAATGRGIRRMRGYVRAAPSFTSSKTQCGRARPIGATPPHTRFREICRSTWPRSLPVCRPE